MTSRLTLLLLLAGCADFERGEPSEDAGSVTPPVVVVDGGGEVISFALAVHPLLTQGCQTCHRAGGVAGNSSYLLSGDTTADFAAALALTDLSNPSQSRLLLKAAGQSHTGGVIYSAGTPAYQTLLGWVSGGAQP